ncbi:MAG: cell division/cell wall cluster transcriptional repressor MraZ [Acidimicrobiia bacterium]|nr:cell division/cell wall cluster transcriptional repressor MraZ [Acidimicrobiia bacterium]
MAKTRPRFVGTHEHGLDDKGRMVLPAKIRAQLGESGMVGMAEGCLGLWTVDGFDDLADRLWKSVDQGATAGSVLRTFMAYAAEVTPDQQGRVVIPQVLRDYAGLGTDVVVNGRRDRAEIWAKARWDALVGPMTGISSERSTVSDAFAALRL